MMPRIAYSAGAMGIVLSIVLLAIAKNAATDETRTVMGCLLYITISVALLGLNSWTKPQSFYIKYEAKHIGHEIAELQKKQKQIEQLKQLMIKEGIIEEEKTNDVGQDSPT